MRLPLATLAPSALALSALALSACAPTDSGGYGDGPQMSAARPERQCFDVRQVENFRQGDTGTVYLRANSRRVFEVNSAGGCLDLDFANRLAIMPDLTGAAGGRVCTGDSARIIVPGSTSPASFCRVRVEKMLSDDEVAALNPRYRP